MNDKSHLILASASPRRRELLSRMGFDYEIQVADVDERQILLNIQNELHYEDCFSLADASTKALALHKAEAVFLSYPDAIVIGADTIVATPTRILGKPENSEDAIQMLRELSGMTHRVYTGVSIQSRYGKETFSTCAEVTFHPLDATQEALILAYVKSGSPLDKAGAYGIQDMGGLLIESIKGDYYTIVGFPMATVYRELIKVMNR
ncbi:MAG TPA: Maf family protein [Bacillota bacterium]|nr:Maf family protein [Bacillota bacterium]